MPKVARGRGQDVGRWMDPDPNKNGERKHATTHKAQFFFSGSTTEIPNNHKFKAVKNFTVAQAFVSAICRFSGFLLAEPYPVDSITPSHAPDSSRSFNIWVENRLPINPSPLANHHSPHLGVSINGGTTSHHPF